MTKHTDTQALRKSLATYRRAAAQLRQSISEMARARAELDSAQDALTDARNRAEVFHSDKPRARSALLVAQAVLEQETRARVARDVLRVAERDLERARVQERAAREELASMRVLVRLLIPLESATL